MLKSIRFLFLTFVTIASLILGPVTPAYALTYPAEVNKSFTPIAIVSGGVSKLRITIYNPNANPLTNASWSDNLIGVQPGLSIANPPNMTHTCDGLVPGSATVTAVAGGTTISLSGGTVPRQIVNTPGSCYVEVDVTSTTPGNLINTLPASVLVATTLDGATPVAITNTTPASATLNVVGVQPPSLSKGFSPSTISVGQKSTLTITLRNNDTRNPLTRATLTDYLPTNVILANPVQHLAVPILNGCGGSATLLDGPGGTPVAPGDTTLTLNNATIARTSNCVITVDVTSLTQGSYLNTIPAGPAGLGSISTREGVTNASPANDTLNVQAFTLTKSFATTPIAAGGVSLMTITINNIASIPYTGLSLTDTFLAPAADNLEFLDDASKVTTCVSGSETITISRVAPAATLNNRLVLANGSIPANSSCTITVNVRARLGTPAATYTNNIPIGAISTTQGATNHAATSANLAVTSLSIAKAFLPTTFAAGQTSTLTITITNPSATPFTGATLADTLPTTLNSNLRYTGAPTTTCTGGAVALSGAPTRTVTLTGGTIPANGNCTITATVTTDATAPSTAYTGNTHSNTIPAGALVTTEGGTNAALARGPVTVTTVSVAKAYVPTTVAYPNASRLRITITNPITAGALTGITLTDVLDSGLEIVNQTSTPSSPDPVTTCNASSTPVLTAVVGTQTITLTNGSLAAAPTVATTCTITVYVRPKVGTSAGTFANTIGPGDLTTAGPGPTNSNTITANLAVNAVSVSKAFQFPSFLAGTNNILTITLTNSTGSDYTGVSISDVLPTTPNSNLRFTGTPTTTCVGGVVTLPGVAPTRTVTMTSGTIPALGSCTITATVTTDSNAPNAAYTGVNSNTIPVNALTTTQGPSNTVAATAPVTVYITGAGMTAAKSFTPATINNGGNSDLQLTFTAPADTALSNFSFTDTFPAGLTISNSTPATNTCGGTLTATTGTGVISLTGGNIAIAATCIVHVWVTSDTGSGPGVVYPNTISPVNITNNEARSIPVAITANLTVLTPSTLTMTKAFYPTVVNPNGFSTLRITLSNTNAAALVNVSLTDTTPGWSGTLTNGFVVAPTPNVSTTCGSGVITAVAGTRTISMASGTIPAQVGGVPGLCTIDVDVQGKSTNGTVPATYTNTIPAANVIATINGTGSTMSALAPATADITVRNLTLEVVKGFVPQLVYGGTVSQMSITLRNPSSAAELTGISFTDNMFINPVDLKQYPAGEMIIASPPNFDPSDCGPAATMTGIPGSSSFSFSGGYLAPDTECTLTLDVSMTVNGNRTNRIPALTVTSFNGASNQTPAEASLTNLAGASIDKSFDPILLPAGLENYSLLTITIRSTALVALNNLGMVDNLPAGLEVAGGSAPAAVNNCGGTLSAAPGDTTIQLTGGRLNLGFSTCTMVIPISGALPGVYTNTIPTNTLTNTENISNVEPAVDTLTLTPYSLGNRVWYDTDNDGNVDGTEVGIPNVRVQLYRDNGTNLGVYDAGDTFVGFDDTDATGYYRFDNLGSDNYIVTIPADNFRNVGGGDTVAGDPLAGYLSSGSALAANGSVSDSFGPDPDTTATDNDDNGASTFVSNALDYVSAQAVTIGPGPTEPTLEANPLPNPGTGEAVDNQSDRTVDFGFYRQQLSNQIFTDLNNDGMFTGADTPLAGAIVQLYASNGTTEIRVGPDGILGTADDATGGVTTLAGGTYLFSGLPAGDYIVIVTPPSGYSTIDSGNSGDSANPNNNIDNNDNGLGVNPGQVSSAVVTLTPGVTGVSTTVSNSTATTLNPSLDFGFVPLYSLGNRVWFDTDNNSAINGAEVGINNVRVELYQDINGSGFYDAGDTPLGFDTTDASGYYRFDNLEPGNYVVLIPSSQFSTGGALDRYWSSGTNIANNGTVTDGTANDPDVDVDDSDDNGITTLTGNAINYVSSQAITLGPGLSEPTSDNDPAANPEPGEAPNDQSNRTVDFGFYRVELSNQIFWDISADGVFGAGDVVLPDAVVRLYTGDGNIEILVGPDGILGTADDAAGGVTSDSVDGTYLFSGLPAGNYIVRVTPPVGFQSTVDSADTATPNSNIDNNDNGAGIATGEVSSNQVALVPGVVSVSNIVANSTGSTLNPSLDFGFVADSTLEFSLGNRVWFDTDNDGTINGSEVGIVNVRVDLYIDNGGTAGVYDAGDTFVGFDDTDPTGYYRFDNLPAGNYVVRILPSQFASGGPLDGYWSSGTNISGGGTVTDSIGTDPDNNVDSDDNGVTIFVSNTVNYVSSRAVTLGPSTNEPVGETNPLTNPEAGEEPDNQSNRTVDFGFYRMLLSDLIFVDINNDGVYNSGDSALAGARVQLYASNGTTEINVGPDGILGTVDDGPNGMVTGLNGLYLFSGLPAGDYIVRVTPPAGYASTVDVNADTTTPNNNVNNNDNGVGVVTGQVSSNPVSLVPGVSGASTTVTNGTGTTYNPSMDFGFNATNGFLKTVAGTSETFTSGTNVAIGEIVTYQITVDLAAGTALNNVVVTDRMDRGLAFVDCLLVNAAGTDLTPTVCPSVVVSSITDPGDLAGNPANPGRQVVFNIGNIAAPVIDSTLVLQYRVIVLDVIENQSGGALNNSATITWLGGSLSSSAPNVNVVEPDMVIDKSANPTTGVPLGTPIQFTLTINHTSPQSTADAFDVVVSDVLPPGLEYVPCSVTYSGWVPTSPIAPAYCPGATNTLTFNWDSFPRGQVAVINFTARLIGAPATNSASVAWTSLDIDPGAGGLPQQLSVHNSESTERWYDPADLVNVYGASDSVRVGLPDEVDELPATGFAPGQVTILPQQPKDKMYAATNIRVEIPKLGIDMPIVGVPLVDGEWDVSWLDEQAGWLNGTAFPGWDGNSVLTGHVGLPSGNPGPFANIGSLSYGDQIIIHVDGQKYIYEVRENKRVSPSAVSRVIKHEELPWITLITCKSYNEATGAYTYRVVVRAVLVRTVAE